jgi:hypothetical protein
MSAPQIEDSLMAPHASLTRIVGLWSWVTAVEPRGVQLKIPIELEVTAGAPPMETLAKGMGKFGCSQPLGQISSVDSVCTPPLTCA